jgi:SHS2 domain-containing protein
MAGSEKYENFDHTADLGLYIYGREMKELLENACEALCVQLTDLSAVITRDSKELALDAEIPDELLRLWLAELLLLFNEKHWLAREAEVSALEDCSLRAVVRGEKFDPARHEISSEIKAVTWHLLKVEKMDDGSLRGTVVLDT